MVLLALTAGMLGAVNPCGFALLPAYLSVLISAGTLSPGRAVARALRCTAALTVGYVVVFGAFGLALTPVAGEIQPRLPWVTVAFGKMARRTGPRDPSSDHLRGAAEGRAMSTRPPGRPRRRRHSPVPFPPTLPGTRSD